MVPKVLGLCQSNLEENELQAFRACTINSYIELSTFTVCYLRKRIISVHNFIYYFYVLADMKFKNPVLGHHL